MGRRGYPPEFRRGVLDLIKSGRKVADVAREFGISDQAIYSWLRQSRVAERLASALTDAERAELIAAKQRIAQLEAELEAQRRAVGPSSVAMRPKGSVATIWKPLDIGSANQRERCSSVRRER